MSSRLSGHDNQVVGLVVLMGELPTRVRKCACTSNPRANPCYRIARTFLHGVLAHVVQASLPCFPTFDPALKLIAFYFPVAIALCVFSR